MIGGGSGGLAAAKEASKCGAKTILFDFVEPTIHGTKWGLGGTCVNVGCIPKKLMHRSARIGHSLHHDCEKYGWILPSLSANADTPMDHATPDVTFQWESLVQTIQMYIKQLNFGYRTGLRSADVTYVNAKASLLDTHTVQYTLKDQVRRNTHACVHSCTHSCTHSCIHSCTHTHRHIVDTPFSADNKDNREKHFDCSRRPSCCAYGGRRARRSSVLYHE